MNIDSNTWKYANRKKTTNYTARDYESAKEELIKLRDDLTDKWTSTDESDPGIVWWVIPRYITVISFCWFSNTIFKWSIIASLRSSISGRNKYWTNLLPIAGSPNKSNTEVLNSKPILQKDITVMYLGITHHTEDIPGTLHIEIDYHDNNTGQNCKNIWKTKCSFFFYCHLFSPLYYKFISLNMVLD